MGRPNGPIALLRRDTRSAAQGPSIASIDPGRQLEPDVDAVQIRNYDHRAGHSIHVTLETIEVDGGLADRSFGPRAVDPHIRPLEPGQYRLRVDGIERHRADDRLDATPAGTVFVEPGNGVVSVTEGA